MPPAPEIRPAGAATPVTAMPLDKCHRRPASFRAPPRASIAFARSVADAAGVGGRAPYLEKSALDLAGLSPSIADSCICAFVVEHLEQPQQLFAAIERLLKVGGPRSSPAH